MIQGNDDSSPLASYTAAAMQLPMPVLTAQVASPSAAFSVQAVARPEAAKKATVAACSGAGAL